VSVVDDHLLYESRVRMRYAGVAAAAGVLLVVAAAIQLSGPHTKVDELTLDLITAHKRFPIDLIGAIVNGIGLAAVGLTLSFLYGITHARNPDFKVFVRYIAIVGAGLAAIAGIAYAAVIAGKADTFVSHGSQTYMEANALTSGTGLLVLPFLGQAAALVLAVGFVMIALNAMRVGLLTRFMGYLGVFVGVLVLFPIGSPVPVVQGFWLLALAYLFSGRWPSGVPASWRTGKAEPWPSSADVRAQRAAARGQAAPPQGGRAKPAPPKRQEAEPVVTPSTPARTRSSTPKRKRKRRH
jgi:hypothetical protein